LVNQSRAFNWSEYACGNAYLDRLQQVVVLPGFDHVDEGKRPDVESSMAKYYSCEAALRVTSLAVQVHGAFGITKEFPVEKILPR